MATKATESEKAIVSLAHQLNQVPENMRIFSLSMRSLYSTEAVGSQAPEAQKFRKLRDDTRNDAVVYLKSILPVITSCISSISDYFEYYETLTFEEWLQSIEDIADEAEKCNQSCNTLMKVHDNILAPLEQRQDEAAVLLKEMESLQTKFNQQAENFITTLWAYILWSINWLTCKFCEYTGHRVASDQSNLAEAVAAEDQSTVSHLAAKVVSDALIPALNNFIYALRGNAKFFKTIYKTLNSFKDDNEPSESEDNPKVLYYKAMKLNAAEIKRNCYGIFATLPGVITDIEAIPSEGTDQNYVDKWLAQQLKVIEQEYQAERVGAQFVKTIAEK